MLSGQRNVTLRKIVFMEVRLLGIRHHGAGSARNVFAMLERFDPDLIFVEGPPEIEPLLTAAGVSGLVPPVAAVCYRTDRPQHAAFYPYAVFSPEWQACCYANQRRIPLRMMDLPLTLLWQVEPFLPQKTTSDDPTALFAAIEGFADTDRWWEHHFEQKTGASDPEAHFQAVLEAMQALRDSVDKDEPKNAYREAWMARLIRQARREMFSRIAVVCGAWHAPALLDLDGTEAMHNRLLKTLPKSKIKTGVTWVPWNNERLSAASGYGAGLMAPGWHQHRWEHPTDTGAQWLTRVARLLRNAKTDISTAHVIEAVRLAECLAALRDLPRPGLAEMTEASESVICMGDAVLMQLIEQKLVVGHAIGSVPEGLPKLPIQTDFEAQCRSLRLRPDEEEGVKALDLRKPLDLRRSVFLHRLHILEIPWATPSASRGLGTFRETWTFEYNPLLTTVLMDQGYWGNTLEEAAGAYLVHSAQKSSGTAPLSAMLQAALPAELFETVDKLLALLQQLSAEAADISDLMSSVSPLANTLRYGNVRKTDHDTLHILIRGFIARISAGLPAGCQFLEEASAHQMLSLIRTTHEAILLLEDVPSNEQWFPAVQQLVSASGIHPLIAGAATRLLSDRTQMNPEEVSTRFHFALSRGQEPAWSASWLEGFLRGSSMVLLYDDALWNLLYKWIEHLEEASFVQLLPILRRTFSKFEPVERKKLGEKAKKGLSSSNTTRRTSEELFFDQALADIPMPMLKLLLGNF